jgi:hypothetical protein
MNDKKAEIKYYNAIFPLYMFLLIFLIVMSTQTKINKKLEDDVAKAVEQTFSKNKNLPRWLNIVNDIFLDELYAKKSINQNELERLSHFSKMNFTVKESIDKDQIYSWNISKDDFFNSATEYIKDDFKIFMDNLGSLANKHSKDYLLQIGWTQDNSPLNQIRLEVIYNILKDHYNIQQISFAPIYTEESQLFFFFLPKG